MTRLKSAGAPPVPVCSRGGLHLQFSLVEVGACSSVHGMLATATALLPATRRLCPGVHPSLNPTPSPRKAPTARMRSYQGVWTVLGSRWEDVRPAAALHKSLLPQDRRCHNPRP